MGVQGYTSLMSQRTDQMEYLRSRLGEVAATFNLQLLQTKNNPISMGERKSVAQLLLLLLLDNWDTKIEHAE